jgi:hypothetical protein
MISLNITELIAGHYSTEKNGLILQDSPTIKWKFDGFGHLSAHFTPEPPPEPVTAEEKEKE